MPQDNNYFIFGKKIRLSDSDVLPLTASMAKRFIELSLSQTGVPSKSFKETVISLLMADKTSGMGSMGRLPVAERMASRARVIDDQLLMPRYDGEVINWTGYLNNYLTGNLGSKWMDTDFEVSEPSLTQADNFDTDAGYYEALESGDAECLFEHYDKMPPEVSAITNRYNEIFEAEGNSYQSCEAMLVEMEAIGYTFDYGLCATPFGLHKKIDSGTYNPSQNSDSLSP